ncbi:hypothetical protein Pmani_026105 [Petrolisthes manimaculis]|uniref:Uncharacterized protein n=1 Tax=Petrolisthes manimaculis TaxID=1843537 RepID=A0AAE1P5E6_9EUCA|nr:hypothetical protein Pmani_026105 [Petrolisthes manimaculis]
MGVGRLDGIVRLDGGGEVERDYEAGWGWEIGWGWGSWMGREDWMGLGGWIYCRWLALVVKREAECVSLPPPVHSLSITKTPAGASTWPHISTGCLATPG